MLFKNSERRQLPWHGGPWGSTEFQGERRNDPRVFFRLCDIPLKSTALQQHSAIVGPFFRRPLGQDLFGRCCVGTNISLKPCVVGTEDFTPPELHGVSLSSVKRTQPHDNFGLAVAIFQLLVMGKHPYAGRYSEADLGLGQSIAQNRFAFSISRWTGGKLFLRVRWES